MSYVYSLKSLHVWPSEHSRAPCRHSLQVLLSRRTCLMCVLPTSCVKTAELMHLSLCVVQLHSFMYGSLSNHTLMSLTCIQAHGTVTLIHVLSPAIFSGPVLCGHATDLSRISLCFIQCTSPLVFRSACRVWLFRIALLTLAGRACEAIQKVNSR